MMSSLGGGPSVRAISNRLYVAVNDQDTGNAVHVAVGEALPSGWALADWLDEATAILAVDVPVTAEMVKAAGSALRVIATLGPPVDARDVRVVEFPNISVFSHAMVAEYTVTLMLTLVRKLLTVARKTAAAEWVAGRDQPVLTDQQRYVYNWIGLDGSGSLRGKSVGIVGLGAIGTLVATLLQPFGVRLSYTQRHRLERSEEQRLGVEWREFDEILCECDVITLHCRLQEGVGGNERRFGEREFAMMKPTAFLINTARGRLIDDDALISALRDHRIAGAALDTFRYEPLPADHPLFAVAGDNVILSSHIAAGSDSEYWSEVLREITTQLGSVPAA
jgi:glyoxylate reductase